MTQYVDQNTEFYQEAQRQLGSNLIGIVEEVTFEGETDKGCAPVVVISGEDAKEMITTALGREIDLSDFLILHQNGDSLLVSKDQVRAIAALIG